MGADESNWEAGVLNPWAGTGEGDKDPLHPDWDDVDPDADRLKCVTRNLLGEKASKGLLLWIPLRRMDHRNRGAEGRPYGLGNRCPEPDDLCKWFVRAAPAALLLAQCGHLRAIELVRASSPEDLHARSKRLMSMSRKEAEWVSRHEDDAKRVSGRPFKGEIVTDDGSWSVVGIEALGSESLYRLRADPDWPQIPQWRNGRHSTVPRKALAHAAVTVLRRSDLDAELSGTRLRWAAFLPLDDDPEPSSGMLVESKGSSPAWEIILHGYFWPSHDRRSIPGVAEDAGKTASDGDMDVRWNRTLCEDLLLPLLPSALAYAVDGMDERTARRLLDKVVRSDMVKKCPESVRRRHWLLPIVDVSGVRWTAPEAGSRTVLSIPKWSEAPEVVRHHFVALCANSTDDVVFIDHNAPHLAGALDDWTGDRLERLLSSIPIDEFGSAQSLRWIGRLIRHVLGSDASGGDVRAVAVVRWLVGRIGEGALADTTRRSVPQELRNELWDAWQYLCDALPEAWLVTTPVDSQQAVTELAADGVIGEGLFPVPFGRRRGESPPAMQLDQERLDRALSCLGKKLIAGRDSESRQRARLLLAEVLLSKRDGRPMGGLEEQPLLRTTRLPEDRDEAQSVAGLLRRDHLVFGSADGVDGSRSEWPSDWKLAVKELAKALDKNVWLVNGKVVKAVASLADVPPPTPEALASAVLRAEVLADSAHRKPLLMRLAHDASAYNAKVCQAARVLLSGYVAGAEDAELFHDPTEDAALHILLRLLDRPWCAVQGELAKSLSQENLAALSVRQVDRQVLGRLLDECLDQSVVVWSRLSEGEKLHLLELLHGASPEEQKRWRKMPLHRRVDGTRGAFDRHALRSTGMTGELRLPPELQEEVCILAPDLAVAHLYETVPCMDRDGVLRAMLEASRPWRFAPEIVRALRTADGHISLPSDSELHNLLKCECWLQCRDGSGLAPNAVLVAPKKVLNAAADLADAGAFGHRQLPEVVDPTIWSTAKQVVREILGRPARGRQIQGLVAALVPNQIAQMDCGKWLVMPDSELVNISLIRDALVTALPTHHPGWKMMYVVAQSLWSKSDGSQLRDIPKPLVELAKAFCAPVPPERQVEMLQCLAKSRPKKESPGGRMFCRLLEGFAKTDDFFNNVLPEIHLPTQDGNWHASKDIARTETGVARRHRLIPEIRSILLSILQLSGDHSVSPPTSKEVTGGQNALKEYFDLWYGRVQSSAVGAFISLLGGDDATKTLARQWLGEDVAIEPIEGWKHVGVRVSSQIASGSSISTMNLLGSRVEMNADADGDTLLAEDPIWCRLRNLPGKAFSPWWKITLRDVAPQSRSSSELMLLLGGTVERWACQYLGLDPDHVRTWWSKWGQGSQADLRPVLASIKAHLPLTLHQLDVQQSEPLRQALRKAEQAQRKREQAPSAETIDVESEALTHLANLVEEPAHREFLWKRVMEVMRRYGYGPDSALLELAQNADDACAQAAEIKGGPLPPDERRLLIQVHEHDGTPPIVDVTHWGRPVNDTGGAAFPAGKERQWDQDLYFMMLMNLSGKPGETSVGSSLSATTGRFGLGFKSVHLVTSSPSVVSGFIAFSIAGGLLPLEEEVPAEMESWEGRRPTRVRLPLYQDHEGEVRIEELFRRFGVARALLPVFARQVREVAVEGGPFTGAHVFDGQPVDNAPGWSLGVETELPDHGRHWRILRFRPADAGQDHMGTAALAVGLRKGIPTAFGPDVPFLWNVAPTSESWGCGYAVNGPVKLDPGRTHVSLDDETTLQVVRELGEALGRGLIDLHDALDCQTGEARCSLTKGDCRGFLSSLWKVLATGLDNPDELRRAFLVELHGNGRGLSAWMAARPVVPSGLPAPFRPTLPPLKSEVKTEVAHDGLGDLCRVLAKIEDEDLAALVDDRCVVSAEVAQIVFPLSNLSDTKGGCIDPIPLRPSALFAELMERWGYCLTPERLHALRPIGKDGTRDFIGGDPQDATWRDELKAEAADGSLQSLRNLLFRGDVPSLCIAHDTEGKDEFLRAAFAPENRVLDPAYVKHREDWRVFRWLRVQHRIDAATMATWYTDLREDRRPAAFDYLLHGQLGPSVLQHLVSIEARPRWLLEYDDVCRLAEDLSTEPRRRQSLLGALFHDRPGIPEWTTPAAVPLDPDPGTFFQRLLEWWEDDDEREKVVSAYEREAWPDWLRQGGIAEGLREDSGDSVDHWLALLVLGACRSLGRTRPFQDRGFLEWAYGEGWWDVFKVPRQGRRWMKKLRKWQDDASSNLEYGQWMSLFPVIYQISRHRQKYEILLKSANARPDGIPDVARLLAPRVDEALTGAGTHFDAPPAPLNMGLHWVLRELVRMEVLSGEHLFQHCWVPSEQVLKFLKRFGLDLGNIRYNPQKARAIFDFMARVSGTENPHLHLAFDIPLRHVAQSEKLRRRFGLEQ